MGKFGRWFWGWYSRIILWRQQYSLSRKIILLNRAVDAGELELSFDLCHMILTSIPPSLLDNITRHDELDESVVLRCGDVWRIIRHLDEIALYIEVQLHNDKIESDGTRKNYAPIGTRSYPADWEEFIVGTLFMDATPRMNSASAYAEILARVGRILNLQSDRALHESHQSYLDRMSHVVLEDCHSLICKLVGLSLNARTQKRPFEIGENR